MVADIFEDFELPFKKFLAMPLNIYSMAVLALKSGIIAPSIA